MLDITPRELLSSQKYAMLNQHLCAEECAPRFPVSRATLQYVLRPLFIQRWRPFPPLDRQKADHHTSTYSYVQLTRISDHKASFSARRSDCLTHGRSLVLMVCHFLSSLPLGRSCALQIYSRLPHIPYSRQKFWPEGMGYWG